ncbi:MAG: hypothetical protein JAY90_10690 [Candidatus Thiodiazotropha lotti]|nr:hypothetical protein [Candidatus Thiodiazotropha lotti]
MEPFLLWAEDKNLTMSWSMHIHLLNWIEHARPHGIKIANETKRELVVASAIRWAAGNMIDAENLKHLAILIRSKSLNGYIVAARKAAAADGELKVKLLQGNSSKASSSDEYALVSLPKGWEHGEWKPIPG